MKKFLSWVGNLDQAISAILLALIFLDIMLQIYSRMSPGDAPRWTVEIGSIFMCAMIWMGIGSGVKTGTHIRFDMIIGLFPPKVRKVFDIAGNVVFLLFVVILAYYTWDMLMWYMKRGNVTTLLRWNKGWTKMPMFIGLVIAGIRLLCAIMRDIARFNDSGDAGAAAESAGAGTEVTN